MKIDLKELKKAVNWIEANTNMVAVNVHFRPPNQLVITCMDKNDSEVEIILYSESQMMPKIRKTEVLR